MRARRFLKTGLVASVTLGGLPSSGSAVALQADDVELAAPSCDYGSPSPDAAPELAQFDFLIGDFTITGRIWQGEDWGPEITSPRARLSGRYILGGRAIQDEWYDNDPGFNPKSTRGVTTRIYDAEAGHWKVTWISADKPVITQLKVAMEDNALTMRTLAPTQPNYDAVFERQGPDRWTRTAFRTNKDGTRTNTWQAIGTRIECP